MIEQGLMNVLLTTPEVTNLTGNVYLGYLQNNHCLPAILIETLNEEFTVDLDGTRKLRNARVAFSCVDYTYPSVGAIAEAVLAVFAPYRGLLLDSPSGPGWIVNGVIPMVMRDEPFMEEARGGNPLNRRIVDLEFWFFPNS